MNYKDEIDSELNKIKSNKDAFLQQESKQKNDYAEFIKQAIPEFLENEEKDKIEEQNSGKLKLFFKKLIKIL